MRPAVPSDLPFVLRWERDYIRTVEPGSEAGWTRAIDRNLELWISCLSRTRVVEAAGEPAGSVMWMPTGASATLVGIHVDPAHRGRGLGRALLAAFTGQARAEGFGELRLGVHRSNPAVRLYEADGYRRTGEDGAYVLYARPTMPCGDQQPL